jgi:hypothetical protein
MYGGGRQGGGQQRVRDTRKEGGLEEEEHLMGASR